MEVKTTNFPIENYYYLKNMDFTNNPDKLLYHQFIVEKYLLANPKLRGILIFHDYGRGKTKLSAQIVKIFGARRRVILITPSGVQHQHQKTLHSTGVKFSVQFIAIKASNLIDQIEQNDDGASFDSIGSLDGSFVVIDEAHNIFNSICNGAKNALELYDRIMSARNIKLLFLTGNPIVNNPFELVPCYNMLAGFKLFPESKEDFDNWFVTEDGHIKNKEKFKNRIMGLVSYYGKWIVEKETNLAKELPLIVIKKSMSQIQYAWYKIVREKELEEKPKRTKGVADRFNSKKTISTYRIKSRQACMLVTKDPNITTDEDLLNPERYWKGHEVLAIVKKHKKQIGMIADNLVHRYGLEDLARFLILNGWEDWSVEESNVRGTSPRFALITGDQSLEKRQQIQHIYSTKENITGDILRILLVGPACAEGISLHHGRYVIIMAPFFNYSRIDQFIYRIIRHNAHTDLPLADQNVQPYLLLSDYPDETEEKKMGEPTTDVDLLQRSKKMKILDLEFYKAQIEVSIDCGVHRDRLSKERQKMINCKMCAPDGLPLWQNPIDVDLQLDDPCHPPAETEIDTKEIIIEDAVGNETKYQYTWSKEHGYEFYEYQPSLDLYTQVQRSNPNYSLLFEAASADDK